ncbi:MAG: amidohydrolase family protein [Gemmatimonadetes bacterium]|nr:amidohydrolase family protein [Gemmatimonadota bacterium]
MSRTLIRNGTLIDGTGAAPVVDGAVLLDGDRIEAVGPLASLPRPAGDVTEIDAAGGTLLPGLIDAHVHLMLEFDALMKLLATPFSMNFYKAIGHMRRTLDAGITTVRDAGGADLGLKRSVEQGLVEGPRMQISITALSITGGHLDFWLPSGVQLGLMQAHPGLPDGICDGVDAVRKKVREVLRAGAEVIKVCSTGGVMSPTDHPDFTQFTPDELEVMVQEGAYRRGIKVMAHAQGAEGVKNALRAGIHSIEHGIWLDDEAIELFLERGAFLVPTLLAPQAVIEQAEANGTMSPWALQKSKEVLEAHRASIRRAHEAGVKIAMGTDAGVMPHGTNLRELGLMCDHAGMTPMEAVVATTRTAAECLGWQDRVGTLEAGKLADVVVSSVDPLADIHALTPEAIRLVVKGGKIVKDAGPAVGSRSAAREVAAD